LPPSSTTSTSTTSTTCLLSGHGDYSSLSNLSLPSGGKRFAVFVNGGEVGYEALLTAISWMTEKDNLVIIHTIQSLGPSYADDHQLPNYMEEYKRIQEFALTQGKLVGEKALAFAKANGGNNLELVVLPNNGNYKEASVKFANDKQFDTVFVGARGLGVLERFFLGSFSTYFIHHSLCDVHICRSKGRLKKLSQDPSQKEQPVLLG